MTRMIKCAKLNMDLEALASPPYPGPLGERIFQEISKQAWTDWLAHQTLLINEYRLNTQNREARAFLAKEMEKFLFGEGSEKPPGFST